MFFSDLQTDFGYFQSTSNIQIVSEYILSKPELSNKKSGGYFNLQNEFNHSLSEKYFAEVNLELFIFEQDKNYPRPDFVKDRNTNYYLKLNKAFISWVPDFNQTLSFQFGKNNFEFSTALLTSPGNPSMAGISLVSPFKQIEGIYLSEIKYIPNNYLSYHMGVSYGKTSTEDSILHPFVRMSFHNNKFDIWNIFSENFIGLGLNWQIIDSCLFYYEGNIHFSRFDYDAKRDFILGNRMALNLFQFPFNFTSEFYYNSEENFGVIENINSINSKVRDQVYYFPSPESLKETYWGASSFLSRELLFFDIRLSDEKQGPFFMFLYSLNDRSYMSVVGMSFSYKNFINGQIEWRHFDGDNHSEFKYVSYYKGKDQIWFTIKI